MYACIHHCHSNVSGHGNVSCTSKMLMYSCLISQKLKHFYFPVSLLGTS